MYGLIKDQGTEEAQEIVDGVLYTYTIKIKTKKVKDLEKELARLLAELDVDEPPDDELLSLGKVFHDFYTKDTSAIEDRIAEIEALLG